MSLDENRQYGIYARQRLQTHGELFFIVRGSYRNRDMKDAYTFRSLPLPRFSLAICNSLSTNFTLREIFHAVCERASLGNYKKRTLHAYLFPLSTFPISLIEFRAQTARVDTDLWTADVCANLISRALEKIDN